jgi:hypothetical protein
MGTLAELEGYLSGAYGEVYSCVSMKGNVREVQNLPDVCAFNS